MGAETREKEGLVVSFSPLSGDGRVLRQVSALANNYQMTVAAFGPFENQYGVRLVDLSSPGGRSRWRRIRNILILLFPRQSIRRNLLRGVGGLLLFVLPLVHYLLWAHVRRLSHHLRSNRYDFIVVNDHLPLPVVLRALRPETPVYLDLHEYFPGQLTRASIVRLIHQPLNRWIAKKYLNIPEFVTVVSEEIAALYVSTGFIKTTPSVVRNVPFAEQLEPQNADAAQPIRIVHHGGFSRARNPDILVDALALLGDGYELFLYFVGNVPEEFVRRAERALGPRVHFRPPVQPQEIAAEINQYDIGVHILPVTSENHSLAMPNKLFEYIQARLAVVVSPNPVMAGFVNNAGVGRVTEGFESAHLANAISDIDRQALARFKERSHRLAAELNWENEQHVLLEGVSGMLRAGE